MTVHDCFAVNLKRTLLISRKGLSEDDIGGCPLLLPPLSTRHSKRNIPDIASSTPSLLPVSFYELSPMDSLLSGLCLEA